MRKPLPSRTAVLELLGTQDRALDAREVALLLGVADASQAGLLRMLDDLVFDGVVTARGDKFKLGSEGKTPDKAPEPEARWIGAPENKAPLASRAANGGKKALKGLPKEAGRAGRGAGKSSAR